MFSYSFSCHLYGKKNKAACKTQRKDHLYQLMANSVHYTSTYSIENTLHPGNVSADMTLILYRRSKQRSYWGKIRSPYFIRHTKMLLINSKWGRNKTPVEVSAASRWEPSPVSKRWEGIIRNNFPNTLGACTIMDTSQGCANTLHCYAWGYTSCFLIPWYILYLVCWQ